MNLEGICKAFCLFVVTSLSILPAPAAAQQFDAAFGVGTITAPTGFNAFGDPVPVSLTGGAYPVFSADVLLKGPLGVGCEISWKGSRGLYAGFQPYRPLFYDLNGVFAPRLKNIGAEVQAGIGWESLRFYQPFFQCGFAGCTNFVSSNHFMGHFGGGIRLYAHGNFFIRPEAHVYLIRINNDFSSPFATRYGISIGYTFATGF